MKVDLSANEYEGIPFPQALAMALMECSGIRKFIDSEAGKIDTSVRNLGTGMACKAMIGTMFSEESRKPLYRIGCQYAAAPADLVFGRSVKHESLSDTALASRLDTVFKMERQQLVYDCYRLVCEKYGMNPLSYSMDSTNFPFYGTGYEEPTDEGTLPKFGGNSKTNRNDLLQKNVQAVCDQNGMLVVSCPFDGNTSDIKMNEEMLKFLENRIDCKNTFVVGDAKLVSSQALIRQMDDIGLAFIGRVPKNFGKKIRDDIVLSALTGEMDESETHKGRYVYGTACEVYGKQLRFIAYCLPGRKEEAIRYLKTKALDDLKNKLAVLSHQSFYCGDDAREAFNAVMNDAPAKIFECTCNPAIDCNDRRANPGGPYWRAHPHTPSINEEAMEHVAREYAVGVLVTDIPFATKDCRNIRFGATADSIVDTYLSEYKIEHAFRFLKSGLGMNGMFIHTPSRQDAVIALSSIAFVLSKAVDIILKKTSKGDRDIQTMKQISDTMSTVIVMYDRDEDTMRIAGEPGATSLAFSLLKRLEIAPELLLGCRFRGFRKPFSLLTVFQPRLCRDCRQISSFEFT